MNRLKRGVAGLLVASVASTGFLQTAQATLIGTEQVARAQTSRTDDRARIDAALARTDVQERLRELGVDPLQASERVAALTDEEAARLAASLENAPAGAGPGVIGAVVFVFVLLLVTDILGLTKVFPFTRSVR
ncbi:MAG: PA2779 family protein [Burkholderiaceae bacterium]|nr:PA2779 family protein [Burkholderiaceae bacterium]MEB2319255.1 PA2779 family protein [Pseudomonadota bacterium]